MSNVAYVNYVIDPVMAFKHCYSCVITEQCVAVFGAHPPRLQEVPLSLYAVLYVDQAQ